MKQHILKIAIRAVVGIIVVLSCLAFLYPRFASEGVVITAGLLVIVTLEYVFLTHENLALSREQLEQHRNVYVDFGLEVENWKPAIWIANLGTATFIVKGVRIRTIGESTNFPIHLLVPAGKIERFGLPEEIYQSARAFLDFDVVLDCTGLERTYHTPAKAFHLIFHDEHPREIREGILLGWPLKCPHCDEPVGVLNTDGLNNFDDARERENGIATELQKTCPQHRSQWLKTA